MMMMIIKKIKQIWKKIQVLWFLILEFFTFTYCTNSSV
jgi:hypothetical protein